MLKIANVELIPLTDAQGPFPRKLDQLFPDVEPEQWKPYRRRYPKVFVDSNTWHCHYGCFLLKTDNRNILVDTGIGPGPMDERYGGIKGELIDRLADVGLSRDDVDTVFFTHLHWDHVSGALQDGEPTFPKATYLLHQADWDYLREGWNEARFADSRRVLVSLGGSGILTLMQGETALTPDITAVTTPGHSPGSMSLVVSGSDGGAIIVGDVLHHPASISEPQWKLSFDADQQQAADTRERVVDQAEKDRLTLVPGHFPAPCFGRVVRSRGKRIWKALE